MAARVARRVKHDHLHAAKVELVPVANLHGGGHAAISDAGICCLQWQQAGRCVVLAAGAGGGYLMGGGHHLQALERGKGAG